MIAIVLAGVLSAATPEPVPLSGTWAFRLDPQGAGVQERWFGQALPERCTLPGSMDSNGFGTPNTRPADFGHLARKVEYTGAAWYQREIDIPAAWQGKRVTLLLERCHWETQAWLDDGELGLQDSLCVPHVFVLGVGVPPGRHRLTVRVDNRLKVNVGNWAHSVTDETQTNWNGIVGRLELRATDPVWLDSLQVYPDPASRTVRARLTVGNATGQPVHGQVTLTCGAATPATLTVAVDQAAATVEGALALPAGTATWDEFTPALQTLAAALEAGPYRDTRSATFGLRRLEVRDKKLTLNGRTLFLRGTLECCIFPLTGYPPTDVASWRRLLGIAKDYGLNHLRFHSWCPPEAAFVAADELGFLFHVECPQWVGNVGQEAPRDRFIEAELRRIVDAYGNHPSFGMLCMGNELSGDPAFLQSLVALGKDLDPRHLYTSSTAWSFGAGDQYNVAVVRGLHGPRTDADFRDRVNQHPVPLVSHEIGQWTFYPNLAEIPKYSGVLEARNFVRIRDDLQAKGLLEQAPAFTLNSGRLSAQLYKEEIEVLLRTPGHGGFQLLDLHDFPGQGTSIVGILDPFWDGKGIIAPAAWRRFCSTTVPLLRLPKRVYDTSESLSAAAEVAHFGPADLRGVAATWAVADPAGRTVGKGTFETRAVATGQLTALGTVGLDLSQVAAPAKLTVTLALPGTEAANDWDIWVYPATPAAPPADVLVTADWAEADAALAAGRKVLLSAANLLRHGVACRFESVFWNPVMFAGQPWTMGLLCDPAHPALAQFPTATYSSWQWYDPLTRSRAMVLDDLPRELTPIVQVIDSYNRNHRLAVLVEAQVGPGKLLVSSIDLVSGLAARPATRQLRASLLGYLGSPAFAPKVRLTPETLGRLVGPSLLTLVPEPPAAGALLRVRAARNVGQLRRDFPWETKLDEVVAREPGFDYGIGGATWKDDDGAAWHSGQNLVVHTTCPKDFVGKLYAHFSDWNNLERVAEVRFEGRELGTLDQYNGPGKWLCVPVTAADSADGKLELSAVPTHANVMITELVLTR